MARCMKAYLTRIEGKSHGRHWMRYERSGPVSGRNSQYRGVPPVISATGLAPHRKAGQGQENLPCDRSTPTGHAQGAPPGSRTRREAL